MVLLRQVKRWTSKIGKNDLARIGQTNRDAAIGLSEGASVAAQLLRQLPGNNPPRHVSEAFGSRAAWA